MNAQLRWRIVDSRMCGPRHLSIRLESGPAPGSTHRNGRTPRHPTHHYSKQQTMFSPTSSIFNFLNASAEDLRHLSAVMRV